MKDNDRDLILDCDRDLVKYNSERRPKEPLKMRYKPEQKEQTAVSILSAVERGFRMSGFDGSGVDGLAQQAGVTSGAFYKHFPSKTAAFDAAVVAGLEQYEKNIAQFQAQEGQAWVEALASYYLGTEHRANIAGGCVVPGLTGDVIRSTDQVRSNYEKGLTRVAHKVETGLPAVANAEKTKRAWSILALLAGGVMLSRAVQNEALAEEIASAVQEALGAFVGPGHEIARTAAAKASRQAETRAKRKRPLGKSANTANASKV